MIKIELWNEDVIGLVVPAKTGIVWTNQTGGTHCAHPTMEGFFVPLHNPDFPSCAADDPLVDGWWKAVGPDEVAEGPSWHQPVDVGAIKSLLDKSPWAGIFKPDPTYVGYWGEAWVPVIINCSPKVEGVFSSGIIPLLGDLSGRSAILTYPNSD